MKANGKAWHAGKVWSSVCSGRGLEGQFLPRPLEAARWRAFADALAFLMVTPAILGWVYKGPAWARDSSNYFEFVRAAGLVGSFRISHFHGNWVEDSPALLYSLVPPLLWAALRLGVKGASTSMLVVTFMSTWGAAHDRGPFAGQGPLRGRTTLACCVGTRFVLAAAHAGERKAFVPLASSTSNYVRLPHPKGSKR